jgi:hypothetical protein
MIRDERAMRTITVSSEVFAAIWRAYKDGDETEDAILRRVFKLPPDPLSSLSPTRGRMGGFYDERSGTPFPEGMRIYRVHKGRKVEALAHLDRWFMPVDGKSFHSLNALSKHVNRTSNENAWVNWKYLDESGKEHLIDEWRKRKGKGKKS